MLEKVTSASAAGVCVGGAENKKRASHRRRTKNCIEQSMDVEDFQQAIDIEFEKLEGFHKQLKKKGISDSKREEVSFGVDVCGTRCGGL